MPYSSHQNSECLRCPAGKYTANAGRDNCDLCDPGYYSNEGANQCNECNVGYYCPGGEPEIPCLAGTFSGSGVQESCDLCAPGTCTPNTGSLSCQDCSPGFYSGLASTSYETCSVDHFCPEGMISEEGAASCYYESGM